MGHRITVAVAAATAVGMMALAHPSEASASPACEHRSAAHVAEHGGITADNAWHLSHGDLPTCDARANREGNDDGTGAEETRRGGGNNEEQKSRYCRRHWYC